MILKFLVWVILIYLVYRMINNFFNPPAKNETVRGKSKRPLGYQEPEIQDVPYREIKDDEE